MLCSMVLSMRQAPARCAYSRIAFCACITSVITSGIGPSSRMLPASTNGVPVVTSVCMRPPVSTPWSTAALMPPQRRMVLMARRWCSWPPATGVPRLRSMPSEVPKRFASMSCVATALPPNTAPT